MKVMMDMTEVTEVIVANVMEVTYVNTCDSAKIILADIMSLPPITFCTIDIQNSSFLMKQS